MNVDNFQPRLIGTDVAPQAEPVRVESLDFINYSHGDTLDFINYSREDTLASAAPHDYRLGPTAEAGQGPPHPGDLCAN